MKFRIYKESKYEFLTTNFIAYVSFSITLIPSLIISCTSYGLIYPFKILAAIGFILVIGFNFFRIAQRQRHAKIRGTFLGYLCFFKDKISINNLIIELNEIQKIKIEATDYIGKNNDYLSKYDYNGSLSNGLDNKVILYLKNGQNQYIRFEQRKKNDILLLKDILVEYYKQNKLSDIKLIEALNLTDYDEIQEFRKHYC